MVKSGVPVLTFICWVIWLLFSLVSLIWLLASVIIARLCVPVVVGVQFQFMVVFSPVFRLVMFCVPRLLVPSSSSMVKVPALASPWLFMVTFTV